MTGKWYQSRMNQAALITGAAILVAAVITSALWRGQLLPEHGDEQGLRTAQGELAKYSPLEVIHGISADRRPEIRDSLRTAFRVRTLEPLETGRPIARTPSGTTYYFWAGFVTVDGGDTRRLVERLGVDPSPTFTTSYFDVLRPTSGGTVFLAYVTDEAAANLATPRGHSAELVLSPSPWGDFDTLVLVPVSRIAQATNRRITVGHGQEIIVVDAVIQ